MRRKCPCGTSNDIYILMPQYEENASHTSGNVQIDLRNLEIRSFLCSLIHRVLTKTLNITTNVNSPHTINWKQLFVRNEDIC